MSTKVLSPKHAAEFSLGIYAATSGEPRALDFFTGHSFFSANSRQLLFAEVGGRLLRSASDAFGLAVMGSGPFKGDLFLIFRGTDDKRNNGADLVTDARIGVINSKHIGFSQTFKSMQRDIDQYVKRNRVIGAIHCIGHSLGGAVATLCAEWATGNVTKNVKLYTFGQPRVGLGDFASLFTQKLGSGNIHRVFHTTDPVPMIPIFPYVHAPLPGFGHQIKSEQKILTAKAHDMTGYIDSVKDKGWAELVRAPAVYSVEDGVKDWLQSKRHENANNPTTFAWLENALLWLIEKLLGQTQRIQLALMGVHTFIDKAAWLLAKGIELKNKASRWVILFMEKVMRILGMSAKRFVVNPTRSFFRFLLETLSKRIFEIAQRAIRGQ